jgi:diadenosine tetraphosphatase ApaH/serine/threonine PP2A family protein phosphatase
MIMPWAKFSSLFEACEGMKIRPFLKTDVMVPSFLYPGDVRVYLGEKNTPTSPQEAINTVEIAANLHAGGQNSPHYSRPAKG